MKRNLVLLLPLLISVTSCQWSRNDTTTSGEESIDLTPVDISEDNVTTIKRNQKDFASNNARDLDYLPSIGEPKVLVIPVWFTDSSDYISNKDNVLEDIKTAYFGSSEETGWESVSSYYEKESFGRLKMDGVVSPWYECGKHSTEFYSNGSATNTLVSDATNYYFNNNPEENRKDYDIDQNGYLDAVMLIYGAPEYISLRNGNASNLWAYCSWLLRPSLKNIDNPGPNVFFWASYDFMYSSGDNALSRAGSYYGLGDTSHCVVDSHTFIHEMGHAIGLNDYYDYDNRSNSPAAGFSMQDHNVGGHDPYSLMTYNWVEPFIPTETMRINLRPFQETHDLILLTNGWNEFDSPFDEYLLLEFYTPTGLNKHDVDYRYSNYSKGPSASGIRLWHVDGRLLYGNGFSFRGSRMTSDPLIEGYKVTNAFSNSTNGTQFLNPERYGKYNELQLIRNDVNEEYVSYTWLEDSHLFGDGDHFDIKNYSLQFPNATLTNKKEAFCWEFDVKITEKDGSPLAVIDVKKV